MGSGSVFGPGGAQREPRARALLQGKLVHGEELLTLDCTIRDWSAKGAKVRLAAPTPLPAEVFLLNVRERAAYRVKVAWRRQPDIGVVFLSQVDLASMSATAKVLRRLLLEASPREAGEFT